MNESCEATSLWDDCVCDVPSIAVSAEPDDGPSDMDDSISVSVAYLDLLIRRSNSAHCRTCSCKQ